MRPYLPSIPTPFVGRTTELDQLQALIANPANQLITIVGPGGAGKTRLALEVAHRQAGIAESGSPAHFPDGIFFIPLAALESADELWPALYQAFGFQPSSQDEAGRSSRQQLTAFLDGKKLLLVLDNFEQLLDGAKYLSDLTQGASGIQVLVTSRERLSLKRERLFALDGMRYPQRTAEQVSVADLEPYSALQLFIQSAQRVDHTFQLDSENLPTVARICRLVNGLPLGIELAATWVDSISLAEIAGEIEGNLGFLEIDTQDIDVRHRSMAAVFDASWRRLSPDLQSLLAQLTVFRGGFNRQAAEAVAQATLLQLNTLIKKSLLQFDRRTKRYEMHRLLRQYGASKLATDPAAEDAARDRHSNYFCHLLETWGHDLKGQHQLETITIFDLEITNARAAWERGVSQGVLNHIDQALDALGLYADWHWLADDLTDMCQMAADKLITIDSFDARRVLSRVLAWQGLFLPGEEAIELLHQGLALIEQLEAANVDVRVEKAWLLRRLGQEMTWQDHGKAALVLEQSITTYRALDDPWGAAGALGDLGANAVYWGKYRDSIQCYQEMAALCREIGDRRGLAESLHVLALNATYLGEFDEAELLARQSLELSEALGSLRGKFKAYGDLAFLLWQAGRFSEAREAYQVVIALCNDLSIPTGEPSAMAVFLLLQEGRVDAAHALAEPLLRDPANEGFPFHQAFTYWGMGTVLLALGNQEQATFWLRRGTAEFRGIGHVSVQAGAQATLALAELTEENIRDSIELALGAGSVLAHLMCLAAVARYLAEQQDVVGGVELYSLISGYDTIGRSRWYDQLVGQPIRALAEGAPAEAIAAAQARGKERRLKPALKEMAIRFGCLQADDDDAGPVDTLATSAATDPSQDARYLRERLLGRGGQAEVHLGRDLWTGQQVAIKELSGAGLARDPASLQRFLREAELLAQLEHPNIVKLLDYLEHNGRPTIVMEYVPSGSLRELLAETPAPPLARTLSILLEVADALARAHHLRIIHRDLKPENVLLAADGTPRLSDFGLARLLDRETQLTEAGALAGTFAYLSPEVIQGLEPDARADIWSFGVMLYEMVAGRPPFTGSQVATVLAAIVSEPAPDLLSARPEAPPELARLIGQMLYKDREQRLGRMRQVAAELELIAAKI